MKPSICLPKIQMSELLLAWITANLATTPKIHLYTAGPVPSDQMVLTDFTEVTGVTWYTALALVVGAPYQDPSDGSWSVHFASVEWDYTTTADAPVIVQGFYVTNASAPAVLVGAYKFANPITMGSLYQSIILDEGAVSMARIVQVDGDV